MKDAITLLVAERDDELRHNLMGQLLADGYQACPARTMNEARCRGGHGPDLLLLGELDDATAALQLLREVRSGDALALAHRSGAAGDHGDYGRGGVGRAASTRGWRRRPHSPVGQLPWSCGPACERWCAAPGAPIGGPAAGRCAGARPAPARGPLRGQARQPGPLRVPAADPPGRRAGAGVHQARAATRNLGLPKRAHHQDARRARLPPRKKLAQAGAKGYVVNRRGVGYRLVERVPAVIDQGEPRTATGNGSGSLIELGRTQRAAA